MNDPGDYSLPMTMQEMLWQLHNGNPCEIPRGWLGKALEGIQRACGNADIEVDADELRARLTPHRCQLTHQALEWLRSAP